MVATAGSVALKARKGRTATVRPSAIFVNNGTDKDSSGAGEAQHLALIPRIIATHWLRPECMEANHG